MHSSQQKHNLYNSKRFSHLKCYHGNCVITKELYQWNASFDRFRGISVHRSPVQADSASPVVGYFRFHCLH